MRAIVTILLVALPTAYLCGQAIPMRELPYTPPSHSKKDCLKGICHKKHIVTEIVIDTLSSNETTVTRIFPRTKKKDMGETLRHKSIEKTYDYTGKLLGVYRRKRDIHKRVSFIEKRWNRDGKLVEKKTGNHKQKKIKEYDDNGKLVRFSVVNKREYSVKKDLTKN